MSMSCADAGTEPVRRFEVFTGAGRRREWSDEAKAAIVAESYSGLENVSAVARRHGLGHSQPFTWRRQCFSSIHASVSVRDHQSRQALRQVASMLRPHLS